MDSIVRLHLDARVPPIIEQRREEQQNVCVVSEDTRMMEILERVVRLRCPSRTKDPSVAKQEAKRKGLHFIQI
jgi:hypothetical protein